MYFKLTMLKRSGKQLKNLTTCRFIGFYGRKLLLLGSKLSK